MALRCYVLIFTDICDESLLHYCCYGDRCMNIKLLLSPQEKCALSSILKSEFVAEIE